MFVLIERDLSAILETKVKLNPIPKNDGINPYWVPVYNKVDNQSTIDKTVLDSPITTIYSNKVEVVRIKRNMTTLELDEEDELIANTAINKRGIIKALAQVLFLTVNDVRVLKGQNEITPEQFKNYLKGLIN